MQARRSVFAVFSVACALACACALALSPSALCADEAALDASSEVVTDAGEENRVASDAEIAEALANGVEGMPSAEESALAEAQVQTIEAFSLLSAEDVLGSLSLETLATSYKVAKVAGSDRYATAVAAAKQAYPSGVSSKYAIIVSGEDGRWPDALAAAGLAGALDAPILYVKANSLPSTTKSALSSLGVKKAIVIGGTPSVSASTFSAIKALGISTTRLGGADRYETQSLVYDYGVKNKLWKSTIAFVASGDKFPDALSVSPLAFKLKAPIILCPSSGTLTDGQLKSLTAGSTKSFVITGDSKTIPTKTEGALRAIGAHNAGSDTASVTRLGGSDRYATSVKIAQWAVSKGYLSWNGAGFASGTNPVDALAGSVLQGKKGAVMLLIDEGKTTTVSSAAGKGAKSVRVYGETPTISASLRNEIAYTLGFKLNDIEGFKVYVDAGHGYNNTGNGVYDSGATGSGTTENAWTVTLARGVAEKLSAAGVDYFLNDDGGPYYYRHSEAIAQGCNVIISIHLNSGGGSGSLSLIHNANANKYSSKVQSTMHTYLLKGTGLSDLGKRTQAVSILGGKLPATLLEVGFIDSSHDMSVIQSRKQQIINQIAAGIEAL